jgi:hypothetical protein
LSYDAYCVGAEHIQGAGRVLGWTLQQRNRIALHHGDARASNPLDFDVTTLFLLPEGLEVLSPWLQQLVVEYKNENEHSSRCTGDNRKRSCRVVTQGWPLPLHVPFSSEAIQEPQIRLVDRAEIPMTGTSVYLYELLITAAN